MNMKCVDYTIIEKPKKEDYRVLFIHEFKKSEVGQRYSFYQDRPWRYDKTHWEPLDDNEMIGHLATYAVSSGIKFTMANDVKFLKDCYDQFKMVFYVKSIVKTGVLINLLNGTLEVNTDNDEMLTFRDHRLDDFMTYVLPYEYDKDATCPKFQAFLEEVLPVEFFRTIILEFIAWCFIPTYQLKLEKTLVLKGQGANGKSVIFDIVRSLIGKNNMSYLSPRDLSVDTNAWLLSTALLNYSSEFESAQLDNDLFKKQCSGEPVKVRQLYKDSFTMENYAKLMFNANSMKNIEHSFAFLRRFILIPFDVTITDAKKDVNLAKKIIDKELPGILNLVIESMIRLWTNKGFSRISEASKFGQQYMQNQDNVYQFLKFRKENDDHDKDAMEMYVDYANFCKNYGYKSLGFNGWSERMKHYGAVVYKSTHNKTFMRTNVIEVVAEEIMLESEANKDVLNLD